MEKQKLQRADGTVITPTFICNTGIGFAASDLSTKDSPRFVVFVFDRSNKLRTVADYYDPAKCKPDLPRDVWRGKTIEWDSLPQSTRNFVLVSYRDLQ